MMFVMTAVKKTRSQGCFAMRMPWGMLALSSRKGRNVSMIIWRRGCAKIAKTFVFRISESIF